MSTFRWAPDDPIRRRMIFVSATHAAGPVDQLTAAWDLYQGGCLPLLRDRLSPHPDHRARVRLISAEHALLHPDIQLLPEKHEMTESRAAVLRPKAWQMLQDEFLRDGVPREVMLLADPPYDDVVGDIFHIPGFQPYTTLFSPRPGQQQKDITERLDRWEWP